MKNKIEKYSNNEIIEILFNSKSFREALVKFGYGSNGSGRYVAIKNYLKKRNIEIPKYSYRGNGGKNAKYSLCEILVENSTYTNRERIKNRLIREGLLEYKCKCGNTGIWQNQKLVLQLEHKNGINNDYRIENLEFLCPNCHSQSKTFAGRNNVKNIIKKCSCGKIINKNSEKCQSCEGILRSRKTNRPELNELLNNIKSTNYTATGKIYGVSDNTIRNWIKYYGINPTLIKSS